MSHVRKQIRDAVVTALGTVGTVHASRVYPVAQESLPLMLVYMGDEAVEGELETMTRTLEVIVEVLAEGADFDDTLDQYLVGIEQALTGDLGLVVAMTPRAITVTASGEGSAPIGRARVVYEAIYRTSYSDPETSI